MQESSLPIRIFFEIGMMKTISFILWYRSDAVSYVLGLSWKQENDLFEQKIECFVIELLHIIKNTWGKYVVDTQK